MVKIHITDNAVCPLYILRHMIRHVAYGVFAIAVYELLEFLVRIVP